MAGKQWSGSTFGNSRLHGSLIKLLRYVGPKPLYLFSYVFVIPVCLMLNDSRRTSYEYFRKRIGFKSFKAIWYVYVNHCRFAETVIDKFAMYAGRKFKVEVNGVEYFNALAAKDEGFLLFSSHVGNYEIAGYSLVSDRKAIHAVVFEHEKESVMRNRNTMFVKTNIRMIALRQDMGHLFEIDQALCHGDIVSFPTDRFTGNKHMECELLGAKAFFPQGPFSVATMRGLNVLEVNVLKKRWGKYTIYVRPLEYNRQQSRKEQMSQLAQAYITELEKRIRQYPSQWYNFYDFWK